jgi:hypothetical protein
MGASRQPNRSHWQCSNSKGGSGSGSRREGSEAGSRAWQPGGSE